MQQSSLLKNTFNWDLKNKKKKLKQSNLANFNKSIQKIFTDIINKLGNGSS